MWCPKQVIPLLLVRHLPTLIVHIQPLPSPHQLSVPPCWCSDRSRRFLHCFSIITRRAAAQPQTIKLRSDSPPPPATHPSPIPSSSSHHSSQHTVCLRTPVLQQATTVCMSQSSTRPQTYYMSIDKTLPMGKTSVSFCTSLCV